MSTHSGQPYHCKFTDHEREEWMIDLHARVQALEASVDELKAFPTPAEGPPIEATPQQSST